MMHYIYLQDGKFHFVLETLKKTDVSKERPKDGSSIPRRSNLFHIIIFLILKFSFNRLQWEIL